MAEPLLVKISRSADDVVANFVCPGYVPHQDQLPWKGQACDAFVVLIDTSGIRESDLTELSRSLMRLPVDWVETLGPGSERLHDIIDRESVSMGRQSRVGDANPMTAWHDDLADSRSMANYVVLGGHGSSQNKLVVVIGPDDCATGFAHLLKKGFT